MGYFEDIRRQKKTAAEYGVPAVSLGNRELEAADALNGVFYLTGTGAEAGRVYEATLFKMDKKTGTVSNVTKLVLESGETVAVAEEWETEEQGLKVSHANVIFNKGLAMDGAGKSFGDYTVCRKYDSYGRVYSLKENDSKRSVRYNDCPVYAPFVRDPNVTKASINPDGTIRKIYYRNGDIRYGYTEEGRISVVEEDSPSKDPAAGKPGIKDSRKTEYDKKGRIMVQKTVRCYQDSSGLPGHIIIRTDTVGGAYPDAAARKETITKETICPKADMKDGDVDIARKSLSGLTSFHLNPLIPKGFAKTAHESRYTLSKNGKRIEAGEEKAYCGAGGSACEVKTRYYENGRIRSYLLKKSERGAGGLEESDLSFKEADGSFKKEEKHFSETGSLLKESVWEETRLGGTAEACGTVREYSDSAGGPLWSETETKKIAKKSRFDFIGVTTSSKSLRTVYTAGSEGIVNAEKFLTIVEGTHDAHVKTEFNAAGEKTAQTATIMNVREGETVVIEKKYEHGGMTGKKIWKNGINVPADGDTLLVTVKYKDPLTEKDRREYGVYPLGDKEICVIYNEDGKICSAEKTVSKEGEVRLTESYVRMQDGWEKVECDEAGNMEEKSFYGDDGEYRRRRFICETKNTEVYLTDGRAVTKEPDSRSRFPEEPPTAITYDLETKTITIDTGGDTGVSAVGIAEGLWGKNAEGNSVTARSPKGAVQSPKNLIDALEAVETALDPVSTVQRAEEISEIRGWAAKEIRKTIIGKHLPLDVHHLDRA